MLVSVIMDIQSKNNATLSQHTTQCITENASQSWKLISWIEK